MWEVEQRFVLYFVGSGEKIELTETEKNLQNYRENYHEKFNDSGKLD